MNFFADNDTTSTTTMDVMLANVCVQISRPPLDKPVLGVTFLLPGSMIAVSEYNSIRDILLQQGQVVLSFYINVLTTKHRVMAERVKNIFTDFQTKSSNTRLFEKYNIVGHSVGAKIALLVACLTDVHRVDTVLSLDPIDMNPPEFTGDSPPLSLDSAEATIHMTWARAGGWGICKSHNPEALYKSNREAIRSFTKFPHAGHMSYADHGGWPGKLMPSPNATHEGNAVAHDGTLALVKRIIGKPVCSTVEPSNTPAATPAVGGPALAFA